jgi:hypothetical protein
LSLCGLVITVVWERKRAPILWMRRPGGSCDVGGC